MPPKSKANSFPITIRLKNGKSTILLPVAPDCTIPELQAVVLDVAQETGLFTNRGRAISSSDAADEDSIDFDDFDIPVPSFETASDDENMAKESNPTAPSVDDSNDLVIREMDEVEMTANDIQLALPRDQRDLSKGWDEITGKKNMDMTTLRSLNIHTGYIIGMKAKQFNSDIWNVEIPKDFDEE